MSQILRALGQHRRRRDQTASRDDHAVLAGLGVGATRKAKRFGAGSLIWVLAAALVLGVGGAIAFNIWRNRSAAAIPGVALPSAGAQPVVPQPTQQPPTSEPSTSAPSTSAQAESEPASEPEATDPPARAAKNAGASEQKTASAPPAAGSSTPIVRTPASEPAVQRSTPPAEPLVPFAQPPAPAAQPPVTVSPPSVDHFKLAVYYQQAGDFDNALIHYRALLQREPLNAEAHNNLGLLYRTKRLHDEAIREFQLALNIDPKYRVARNNLGATLLEAGRPEAAATELKIVVDAEPDSPDALVNLALAQSALKQNGTAQETLMRAIGLDPRHAAAHYNLGRLYEQDGETGKALDHYRKFLQYAAPHHASAVADVKSRIAALEKKG